MLHKKLISVSIVFIFSSLVYVDNVYADTLYVSDIQFVSIRAEATNNSRIVERGLRSGIPLEVVERVENFTKVATPKGNQGWIANYYLVDNAVSRDVITKQEAEIISLVETKLTLTQEINQLKNKLSTLESSVAELTQKNTYLDNLTQNTQSILESNNNSEFEIKSLQQRLHIAETSNKTQNNDNERQWFLLGAVTLLIGLLAGFTLPLIRRKKTKTNSW